MKNINKNAFVLGAFVTIILLASSATALTTIIPSKSSEITCVKSGIYISGAEQRKVLSDSLNFITYPDAYQLVQSIITLIDSKGFVNSKDVEQIIDEYDLEFNLIAGIGAPITTGANPNPGHAIRPGHPLQKSGTVILGVLFWTAKQSLNPARNIDITITLSGAQSHINIDKSGLSIGFSGTFSDGEESTGHWFTIQGSALMHIVW